MANDPFLGMLGLARRAGKLAFGDELVREMCADKKARAVFVAADAGASTAKKAAFYAEGANVPCITLPHGKDELGMAIGKNGCAVCAVSDIGGLRAVVGARPGKALVLRGESALPAGGFDEAGAAAFAADVAARVPMGSNSRGSAAYRTHLAEVLTRRCALRLGGEL